MNYFFGINNNLLKSEIQIPKFQNKNFKKTSLKLFKSFPSNNKWIIQEVEKKKISDYFYIVKNQDILNNEIFFLAEENILDEFSTKRLKNYNSFTDTFPAFRVNLKIYLINGGFSSFQSEYPNEMIGKKGSILSSVNSIANTDADKNYILIRNIFEEPIEVKFKVFLVNIVTKKIEKYFEVKTNNTNCFELKKEFIKPEIFLVSENYLGIPMYVSIKNNFLSFEHTHPPHEYILSSNKYKKVSNLKKEINEIIS